MLKEVKEVGQRGVIFQFEDQNLVYLIKGDKRLYLCDTHLGPKSMEFVKDYLQDNNLTEKELIIFNSHSDYDHNWGNCAFKNRMIIAQNLNLKRFKMRGENDLKEKSHFQNGKVELVYPNLLFEEKLYFADDEIEFIYAPGHTEDSAICLDHLDSTVYVGDLIEAPIPIILWSDLKRFIKTVQYLKSLAVDRYIASHSGIVAEEIINDNLEYLRKLLRGEELNFKNEDLNRIHEFNQNFLLD